MTGAERIVPNKPDHTVRGENEWGVAALRPRRYHQFWSGRWVTNQTNYLSGAGGAFSVGEVQIDPCRGNCYRNNQKKGFFGHLEDYKGIYCSAWERTL